MRQNDTPKVNRMRIRASKHTEKCAEWGEMIPKHAPNEAKRYRNKYENN